MLNVTMEKPLGKYGRMRRSVSEGEQSDTVQRSGADGAAVSPSSGDRRDSTPEIGAADEGASGEESVSGQKDEPDGVGTPLKQPESTGGRDDTGGTYQQLSLFPSDVEEWDLPSGCVTAVNDLHGAFLSFRHWPLSETYSGSIS